jgi:Rieske Fe-S protein
MSWEKGEKEKRWTRREWVKMSMTLGTVGALGGLGGLLNGQLLPPPIQVSGEVREGLYYTKFPTPQWWNDKDGTPVKIADFKLWDGATAVWKGLYQNNQLLPGTGFPCIVIRIPFSAPEFTFPDAPTLAANKITPPPAGFEYYYEDKTTETRIVVCYDRCVHLCCYPGWHVVENPPPGRDYVVPPPTWNVYKVNPIYCICHGSQYDPLLLTVNFNPHSNVNYIGAERVHGPAPRALVVIPVKDVGGALVGGMPNPNWYVYC